MGDPGQQRDEFIERIGMFVKASSCFDGNHLSELPGILERAACVIVPISVKLEHRMRTLKYVRQDWSLRGAVTSFYPPPQIV